MTKRKPQDPYVFLEWKYKGQYYGANYKKSQVPQRLAHLKSLGVENVNVDDVEVKL